MKHLRKFVVYLLLVCTLLGGMNLNVYAAESNEWESGEIVAHAEVTVDGAVTEMPIVFVTEEEMSHLIETGGKAARDNWVTDYVALTVTRDSSNSNKAKIVLMNVGFMFDVVDSVKGSITFYNAKGQKIIKHKVDESRLVYGWAHTDTVTATGFTKISYALTVTDGGKGTLNEGERDIP